MYSDENGYVSYQNMLTEIMTQTESLKRICTKLELKQHTVSLDQVSDRLRNHVFRVGILGEFKRGKSTVINALLGQEVVPADILPCTATLNRVTWDVKPHARIIFKKDSSGKGPTDVNLPVEELSSYVTKLTEQSESQAQQVEEAVVSYPCRFCQNGVEIIDTPGLNDDERMDIISENVIPTLDAIIMVVTPGAPFSMSEANFVRSKIMTSDLSRLIFVVNKIDTVRKKDRERCVEGIRKKIHETVLEKTASMYGKESAEYANAKSKLSGIRIYPLSAADALDGKLDGDADLLEQSCMPAFEHALTVMLTEERGMLELMPCVNAILSKLKEADDTIVMRSKALNLESAQFEKMQKEAIARIEESRKGKRDKVREIKGIAYSLNQEMQPDIVRAYDDLEQAVEQLINNYSITPDDVANNSAVEEFTKKISSDINQVININLEESTEKMMVKIQNRLQEEVEGLEVYSEKLTADVQEIRDIISPSQVSDGSSDKLDAVDMVGMGVEVLTNFTNIVPGLGGAISGFKDHGVLGGVVGFGAGFVSTYAAYYAAANIVGLFGAAALSTFAVPVVVIAGVAGAFGGKKIANALFDFFGQKPKQDKVQKVSPSDIVRIRSGLLDSAKKNLADIRKERKLESWLGNLTNDTFTALSNKLDTEAEATLQGLQDSLTQVQMDLSQGKARRENIMHELNDIHQELTNIANRIAPIKNRLDHALRVAEGE